MPIPLTHAQHLVTIDAVAMNVVMVPIDNTEFATKMAVI